MEIRSTSTKIDQIRLNISPGKYLDFSVLRTHIYVWIVDIACGTILLGRPLLELIIYTYIFEWDR